jgi:hypothetical protein
MDTTERVLDSKESAEGISMHKDLLALFFLTFIVAPSYGYAKFVYVFCDGKEGERNYKYSVSAKELYVEDGADWLSNNNAEFRDDRIISDGWTMQTCDSSCNFVHVISLIERKIQDYSPYIELKK